MAATATRTRIVFLSQWRLRGSGEVDRFVGVGFAGRPDAALLRLSGTGFLAVGEGLPGLVRPD
jgi:hypothetical protein